MSGVHPPTEAGEPRVALVGAGPGDPELLTVLAARLIAEADDLLVDALVPPRLYRDSPARVLYLGKRAGRPHISQQEILRILVRLGKSGRRVVRLKGGDPCIFGRGGEEMRALDEAGIPYRLVPGISSALAAPAAAGIPVTERRCAEQVLILTGHRRRGHPHPVPRLPRYRAERTVIILMGLGNLGPLTEGALGAGYPPDLPAAVISEATLPGQTTVAAPLSEIAAAVERAGLRPPATVVLGWVAQRAAQRLAMQAEAATTQGQAATAGRSAAGTAWSRAEDPPARVAAAR